MIVKEFRVPLPLSVEQYRKGREYCIEKSLSNREDAEHESGVVETGKVYINGDGTQGVYRKFKHNIGASFPSILRSLVSSKDELIEEVYDEYPYIRSSFTCRHLERFRIDTFTYYMADYGQNGSIFKNSDFCADKEIEFELIDILSSQQDAKIREQLLSFVPNNGNKQLKENWLTGLQNGNSEHTSVMCSYKLMAIDYRYGFFESKVGNILLNNSRKKMINFHSNLWLSQNEWCRDMEDYSSNLGENN
ncbi:Membrane-associated phosphatidylinositol transfer protein 2 [Thelohanellus kitauei]|uniref:Membrane-associated phosphatidylinositol transfer protein 2 n=1 Tax=Thelohanellus kitauei TaxID=669202 RepID=A0A0C2N7Z3_THEKT|nr:Membrane-associated phosphatidylinositol transfer protein 2 [Thelohanellus kitauei]